MSAQPRALSDFSRPAISGTISSMGTGFRYSRRLSFYPVRVKASTRSAPVVLKSHAPECSLTINNEIRRHLGIRPGKSYYLDIVATRQGHRPTEGIMHCALYRVSNPGTAGRFMLLTTIMSEGRIRLFSSDILVEDARRLVGASSDLAGVIPTLGEPRGRSFRVVCTLDTVSTRYSKTVKDDSE